MDNKYYPNALLFKAFADTNRLMIVDMLSYGELCACKILEGLGIAQPTLSHHMKMLCDCGLVSSRKDGKWTYYSLDSAAVERVKTFLSIVTSPNENCVCEEVNHELR
ncbi:MAG: metalloregulator ArsR/SmtB family transcription factor [Defluviitaleaceae bacterium]|nr:metalloregulator ArsR/SmtB family transcription factor [Defluviitaleaceae bacterium]